MSVLLRNEWERPLEHMGGAREFDRFKSCWLLLDNDGTQSLSE